MAADDGGQSHEGDSEYEYLSDIFQQVEEIVADNMDYFSMRNRSGYSKFLESFQSILNILDPLQISLEVITGCCSKFDLKPSCKGNGYRSIINIVEACLHQIIRIAQQIQRNRDKLFFRSYHMFVEFDSYAQVLARLLTVVHFAIVLLDNSNVGSLFSKSDSDIIDDMLLDFDNISRECFYGRSFGFQYAHSIRKPLQVVAVAMAAYGDGYNRHTDSLSRAVSSVIHSGKYVIDPELRAKRITELTQNVDIDFCKAFWSLTEEYGAQHAPLLVCPAMAVNVEFTIPADDIVIQSLDGRALTVKLPVLNGKQKGVNARLLSFVWREGQMHNVWQKDSSYGPLGPRSRRRSRYLMIHCHGGGFVAQSSKSHEMYLRYWAKELRIPILSIDYSLSPDAPFPHALNEIFFAYVWALKNMEKLGTTGAKIVFTGDSAGGNLITSALLKAIESNIRLPDSLVIAYPPFLIQYLPSASRILCLMDPLLPLGVLKSCIKAYAGNVHMNKNASKKLDISKLSSQNYNPFELDLGKDECRDDCGLKCGLFRSLSESKLDMLKHRFSSKFRSSDEDDYFSDCSVSDFEDSCFWGKQTGKQKSDSSDQNSLKEITIEEIAEKKTCIERTASSGSLFKSLTSQMSSRVVDLTTSVTLASSKVYDDLKSSVAQQVPAKVFDLTKGFSSYLLNNSGQVTSEDFEIMENSKNEFPDESTLGNSPAKIHKRKRSEDVFKGSKSIESIKVESTFSICRECLHSCRSCVCGMKWRSRLPSSKREYCIHDSPRRNANCDYAMRLRSKSLPHTTKESKEVTILLQRNFSSHELKEQCIISSIMNEYESRITTDSKNDENKEAKNRTLSFQSDKHLSEAKLNKKSLENNLKDDLCGEFSGNCEEVLQNLSDSTNPLMSPYYASDEMLMKMPPVSILACSLDPLFDDSVEFIRKLQKLDKEAELYVLDRLPHGFLNFQVFSSEAREGCDLMIACIKKTLNMGMRRNDSSMSFAFSK